MATANNTLQSERSPLEELVNVPTIYHQGDAYEDTYACIRAALALNCVLGSEAGEDGVGWCTEIVADLHAAQQRLLLSAAAGLKKLNKESWHAHAQLGVYGDEAKERSLAKGRLVRRTKQPA